MYADQLIDLMTVGQIAQIMKFGDFIMNLHNLKCKCLYLSRDRRQNQFEHTLLRVTILRVDKVQ